MNLKEVLEAHLPDPVLLGDGASYWTVPVLLDELRSFPDKLNREVSSCADYVAALDQQGDQIAPPLYTLYPIGETPYSVEHNENGYQVRLIISAEQGLSRPIHGQSRYRQKQAAYRRKSRLNTKWQKTRVLGA